MAKLYSTSFLSKILLLLALLLILPIPSIIFGQDVEEISEEEFLSNEPTSPSPVSDTTSTPANESVVLEEEPITSFPTPSSTKPGNKIASAYIFLSANQGTGNLTQNINHFSVMPGLGGTVNFGFLGLPHLEAGISLQFFRLGGITKYEGESYTADFSYIPIGLDIFTPVTLNKIFTMSLHAAYNLNLMFISINNHTESWFYHAITPGIQFDVELGINIALLVHYNVMILFERSGFNLFHQPGLGIKYRF